MISGTLSKWVRSPLAVALCAVAALVAFASATFYQGPYRWLTETQLTWSGRYYPELSFGLTFLAIYVILLSAVWLAVLMLPRLSDRAVQWVILATFGAGYGPRGSRVQSFFAALLFLGALLAAVGGFIWWRGSVLSRQASVSVASLEGGRPAPASYLTVDGLPLWDAAIQVRSWGQTRLYCPMVSPEWRAGQPVQVFVSSAHKISRMPFDKSETQKLTGIRSLQPMPGPVRLRLAQAGFTAAPNAFVLSLGDSPESYLVGGRAMTGSGAALAAICVLVLLVLRLRGGPDQPKGAVS